MNTCEQLRLLENTIDELLMIQARLLEAGLHRVAMDIGQTKLEIDLERSKHRRIVLEEEMRSAR